MGADERDIAVTPRQPPSRLGLRQDEPELDVRAHDFEVTAEFAGQGFRSADALLTTTFQTAPDYSTYVYPPAATAEQLLIPLPR